MFVEYLMMYQRVGVAGIGSEPIFVSNLKICGENAKISNGAEKM